MPAIAAAAILASGLCAPSSAMAQQNEAMRKLAGERGCTVCHRDPAYKGSDAGNPLAPTFPEIAARYRAEPDAEKKLVRIVTTGADPSKPHWKNRLEFTSMGGNAPKVTQQEARSLVRWILSTR